MRYRIICVVFSISRRNARTDDELLNAVSCLVVGMRLRASRGATAEKTTPFPIKRSENPTLEGLKT
jgi:hypothetical protein